MGTYTSDIAACVGFARGLFAMNLKASLAQRSAFAVQVLFMALNNFTFFTFWWILMRRVPHLYGWRLADIQLLFGIVAVGIGLAVAVAGGARYLGQFIENGDLDTLLTQPKPVLLHALGLRIQASGVGDMLSGLLFIALCGQVGWRELPFVLVVIVASAMIFVASSVVFFGLAFWLGQVETLARQLCDLLITFSLYPEPFFGGALRFVLFTVLPAGLIGWVPVHVVHEPSIGRAALLVVVAVVYLVVAATIFNRGLRRYTSGSRFGTFG